MNGITPKAVSEIGKSGGSVSTKNGADKNRTEEDLRKACADFESIFIYQLLTSMRKTIPAGGFLSNKNSWSDTYTMMFDQKVAEDLADRGGGLGLQGMLYRQLGKSRILTGKD
ncbi:MAG: rod-binding protein [Deltaproteobacteria bacterium]|nr:rod-binding protein [Deltaproteobacteria bacterium]